MNQVAIVTGGASGVGLAVAERLLDDGWYVAITDADREALMEAEDLLDGEVAFLTADVTDEDEIAQAFDQVVESFGLLTALVNCAGIRREAPFEDLSAELMRHVLDVNLVGTFVASQAALARMGEALSIVNLASVSGLRATGGAAAYGASKAGVKAMSEVMALELASRGVRVNCVAPGLTEASAASFDEEGTWRAWVEGTPQRRLAAAGEVAGAVAYLLSAEASFVNGHTLVVDGGFSLGPLSRGA